MSQTVSEDQLVFVKHSKSFSWAARFLEPDQAADAAQLYVFCRTIDDLADEGGEAGAETLEAICQELNSGQYQTPPLPRFMELNQRRNLSTEAAEKLVTTCASDGPGLHVQSMDELIRYAYGVASTVGLLMCPILGVRDLGNATPFAIDLGIGMQLTNIARDVLEDAHNDRVYLPAEYTGSISAKMIVNGEGDARERALSAVMKILEVADQYYASANHGLKYIPLRPRLAILVASRVYQAIGFKIRARGTGYWQSRTFVTKFGKVWYTAAALLAALFCRKYWAGSPEVSHDSDLHVAISDFPGTTNNPIPGAGPNQLS